MTWKPHVTVAAIIEQDNQFLLVEEKVDGKLVLNQPAGHLESGESIIEAVIRETREESGCIFKPEYLVGLYRWLMPKKNRTYIRYSFAGEIEQTIQNAELDTDIIRTVWLSYDDICKHQSSLRSPLVMQCIDDYRSGQSFSLNLLKEINND